MQTFFLNRSYVLSLIAAALIFLFVYTATSKIYDIHGFRTVMAKSPLIGRNAFWLSWLIPSVELVISIFLFIPHFRNLGFLLSSILMAIFSLYIGYMILFIPKLPCSCGGIISSLTWPQHLIFNLFFLAISTIGWIVPKRVIKSFIAIKQDKPNTCLK